MVQLKHAVSGQWKKVKNQSEAALSGLLSSLSPLYSWAKKLFQAWTYSLFLSHVQSVQSITFASYDRVHGVGLNVRLSAHIFHSC